MTKIAKKMKAKLIKDFEDNGEFIFFPVGISFKVLLKESCLLILSEFFLSFCC